VPLETATFISGLVPSNPSSSDGLNQADDHLRLIKATLQATFPNIAGAVTASDTQLNSLLSQLLGTTSYAALLGTVAAPSYSFLGDTNTGWYSPGADQAALAVGGVAAITVTADKKATFAGAVAATGPISGPGVTPIGSMVMWLTDTLPTGNGVWAWANGGVLSRTALGAGKELFDLVGTTYGVGDGSTTFNVINMQEVAPVGKSTMGTAASPGLLASISAGLKAALGGLFGTDTVTLARTDLPNVAPTFTGSAGTVNVTSTRGDVDVAGSALSTGGGQFGFNTVGTTTFISSTGSFTPAGTVQSLNGGVTQTATANTQPSRAVNFIIRIA
jgi:microcystin-dependent protein